MIVYDEHGNAIDAATLDYSKGYLTTKQHTIRHDAVMPVAEQGHWETIADYPATGGKDVAWIVDVPGVEGHEAYDEVEEYYAYVPYTAEELAAIKEKLGQPTTDTRVSELEAENKSLKAQLKALGDRGEFLEDCIAEMAMQVYQ